MSADCRCINLAMLPLGLHVSEYEGICGDFHEHEGRTRNAGNGISTSNMPSDVYVKHFHR